MAVKGGAAPWLKGFRAGTPEDAGVPSDPEYRGPSPKARGWPRLLLDNDGRADPDAIIEVDHVLVGEANASRRNRMTNRFRFI
jgi:hypothetical protein